MANDLGEIKVNVKSEGAEQVGKDMEEATEGGFLGDTEMPSPSGGAGGDALMGGAIGGGLGSMVSDLTGGAIEGIVSLVKGISKLLILISGNILTIMGVVATMESIQKMIDAFNDVVEAFFVPFLKMALKLMRPVLVGLIELLPAWYEFMDEYSSSISNFVKTSINMFNTLKNIYTDIGKLVDYFTSNPLKFVKAVIHWLWGKFQNKLVSKVKMLPSNIYSKITGLFPEWENITNPISKLKSLPNDIFNEIKSLFPDWTTDIINPIENKIGDLIDDIVNLPGKIASKLSGGILSKQSGGMIHSGGLYRLHANEAVFNQDQLRELGKMINQGGDGGTKRTMIELKGDARKFMGMREKNPNLGR